MDKCTREVHKQYWKNIITQCLQRPEGMTVKQWLEDNGKLKDLPPKERLHKRQLYIKPLVEDYFA